MANESPAQAINVVKRVVEMCDFIEHPTIQEAIQQKLVPRPLPPAFNAVVDISVWVGLGTVGLWAALDSFAERACLKGPIQTRFRCQDNEGLSLLELEDIRHLYAHNYAGVADDKYFHSPATRTPEWQGRAAYLWSAIRWPQTVARSAPPSGVRSHSAEYPGALWLGAVGSNSIRSEKHNVGRNRHRAQPAASQRKFGRGLFLECSHRADADLSRPRIACGGMTQFSVRNRFSCKAPLEGSESVPIMFHPSRPATIHSDPS